MNEDLFYLFHVSKPRCADLLTIVDHIAKGKKECHTSSEFVTKKYA